jgi:ferredoxin-NADP reductase
LLSITVKAIPNGKVSNHIVRRLSPGTLVHLDQASGDFVLPRPLPARTLFLTAGSGVTPVMGLLRNHLDGLPDVVVVHSAPTRDDVIFGDQLRDWAGTGRLRLVERYTETEGILVPAHLDDLSTGTGSGMRLQGKT